MPVAAAYTVCAIVWGTSWFAVRICVGEGGFPPFLAAALRFGVATVLLGCAVFALRPAPAVRRPAQWGWMAVAGLLNACSYALVYHAEQHISGGLAATVFSLFPLAVGALAVLTRAESVRMGEIFGAVVAAAGIAFVFWDRQETSAAQGLGIAMMLAAVVASAVYSLILKREIQSVHPMSGTFVFLAWTAIGLGAAALVRGEALPSWPLPKGPGIALLYLAVFASLLTFGSYLFLLKRARLMMVSTLAIIEPLIALVIDVWFEHKVQLGVRALVGVAFALVGVGIGAWSRARKQLVV